MFGCADGLLGDAEFVAFGVAEHDPGRAVALDAR